MKNYHTYKQSIANHRVQRKSVGVTEYSVEATMPSGNSLSDTVAQEAITNVEGLKVIAEMESDCKYLEDRLHRVSYDYTNILHHRLKGYSSYDIAYIEGTSERTVNRYLNKIASEIVCP